MTGSILNSKMKYGLHEYMEEITIRINDIKGVANGVITYTLPDNSEHYIDLERCRRNWVDYVNSSNDFRDRDGKKSVLSLDTSRYIGATNTFFEERGFVFYENVHVKLLSDSEYNKKEKTKMNELFKRLSDDKYRFFDYT